jgi:hypothetical protein
VCPLLCYLGEKMFKPCRSDIDELSILLTGSCSSAFT